jgi:prepilin-type N-terminal cleavage/methylation domain-containing protein
MKNDKGFSLIEILIAIGILCGLSVWMMQIFAQQTKNEKSTSTNLDIDSMGNEMRNILADGLSCEKTFKGKMPTTAGAANEIYKVLSDGTAQKRYSVGEKKVGNTGVAISSLDLKQDDIYFVPAGKPVGETVLHISYDRGRMINGAKIKDFKIPLSITVDDTGKIDSCHALASTTNLASLCNAIGRSVDSSNKKCSPPTVYVKGDIPIYSKQYIHCQGGTGSSEHTLADWTSPGTGSVRLSWSAITGDNSAVWKVYKNSEVVYTSSGTSMSADEATKDVDIKKGDIIKHTAVLSGGVDSDCISGGNFMVGADLLNMI